MKQLIGEIRHNPILWLLVFVPVVFAAQTLRPRSERAAIHTVMILIATMTMSFVTNSGRSAWFVGVLLLMVYFIFAMTLYLLPPRVQMKEAPIEASISRETRFG